MQLKIRDDVKTVIFDTMLKYGLGSVTVEFDGGGDSGNVDGIDNIEGIISFDQFNAEAIDVEVVTDNGQSWDGKQWVAHTMKETKNNLTELFEWGAWQVLEDFPFDWVNNDGGYGTLTFTKTADSNFVTCEYSQRVTTTVDHTLSSLEEPNG